MFMGGQGSGKYSKGRRLTVEEVSCLRTKDLLDTTWCSNSGRVYALYTNREGRHAGWVILQSRNGQNQFQHTIWLEYTAQPLGRDRAWFQCPDCQDRKSTIYLYDGNFKCRCCHSLSYQSRQLSHEKRNLQQAKKIYARLTDHPFSWWKLPGRPKGMHLATYSNLIEKLKIYRRVKFDGMYNHEN